MSTRTMTAREVKQRARILVLEAALRTIMHHCEVAATHAAIHRVAEKAHDGAR